jgi:hypothetical protein
LTPVNDGAANTVIIAFIMMNLYKKLPTQQTPPLSAGVTAKPSFPKKHAYQ